MSQRFPTVWYATPKKFESMTKLVVFSDQGALEVSPEQVYYRGKKAVLSLRKTVGVSFSRQRIPWVTYAVINIAAVAYFADTISDLLFLSGIIAILVVGTLLVGFLVGASTKWVAVEYEDESHQHRMAYFADASSLGWGGILGGTAALYHAMKQVAEQAVGPEPPRD